MKIEVNKAVYHRNGITGIGFWAIHFNYSEDGRREEAIATVDDDDVGKKKVNPGTRILMLDENGYVDLERTMRGDHFHNALCDWIIKEARNA